MGKNLKKLDGTVISLATNPSGRNRNLCVLVNALAYAMGMWAIVGGAVTHH